MLKTMLMIAGAAWMTLGSAAAQSVPQPMVAHIPFEFHSAGKVLPAGTYTISTPSTGFVRVQCKSAKNGFVSVVTEGRGGRKDGNSWLAFQTDGGRYVLTGITVQGGQTFAPPVRESERAVIASAAGTRTVLLAQAR